MITLAIKTLSQTEFRIVDFESNAYFAGDQQQTVSVKHRMEGGEHVVTFGITHEIVNRKVNKKAIIKTSASFSIQSKDNRIIQNPNNEIAIMIFAELTLVCSSHTRAFFKQASKGTEFEQIIIPYKSLMECVPTIKEIVKIGYAG